MRKYTREERKQILKALKVALQLLWNGRGRYNFTKETGICDAIYLARLDGKISGNERALAVNMIADRIGSPGWYVTDWLRYKHGIAEELLANDIQVQRYRKRWLKAMIKEFSK